MAAGEVGRCAGGLQVIEAQDGAAFAHQGKQRDMRMELSDTTGLSLTLPPSTSTYLETPSHYVIVDVLAPAVSATGSTPTPRSDPRAPISGLPSTPDNWKNVLAKALTHVQWLWLPEKQKRHLRSDRHGDFVAHVSPYYYVKDTKGAVARTQLLTRLRLFPTAHLKSTRYADSEECSFCGGRAYQSDEHLFAICPFFAEARRNAIRTAILLEKGQSARKGGRPRQMQRGAEPQQIQMEATDLVAGDTPGTFAETTVGNDPPMDAPAGLESRTKPEPPEPLFTTGPDSPRSPSPTSPSPMLDDDTPGAEQPAGLWFTPMDIDPSGRRPLDTVPPRSPAYPQAWSSGPVQAHSQSFTTADPDVPFISLSPSVPQDAQDGPPGRLIPAASAL